MQHAAIDTAEAELATVPVLLERVGVELETLAASADKLQDLLGPLLHQAATEMPHIIGEVQRLDAMAQTLASLSGFVSNLGRCGLAPDLVPIEAMIGRLPLSDLADRLSGRPPADEADGFELF